MGYQQKSELDKKFYNAKIIEFENGVCIKCGTELTPVDGDQLRCANYECLVIDTVDQEFVKDRIKEKYNF